jgi:hypothetical protein
MTTAIEIATIIERAKPRSPDKCHTFDDRGWSLCGEQRLRVDEDGRQDRSGMHHRRDCVARGHGHCVPCDEIKRQLTDDFMVG